MSSAKRAVYELSLKARYMLTPKATRSELLENGRLQPDEFVVAGDQLIAICPMWSWRTCPEEHRNPDLPADKQYLYYPHIISTSRASTMAAAMDDETEVPDFDGWYQSGENAVVAEVSDDDSSSDFIDIDDLDVDDVMEDKTPVDPNWRAYDIYIMYDKLHWSPHVYLNGIKSDGSPLTFEEMSEDISASHLNKTVTYDDFPMIGQKALGIHPCKHASVMHKLIQSLPDSQDFTAPAYFFLFLKFIHSAIPTINIATPEVSL